MQRKAQRSVLSRGLFWRVGLLSAVAILGLMLGFIFSVAGALEGIEIELDNTVGALAESMDDFLRGIENDLRATSDVLAATVSPETVLRRALERREMVYSLRMISLDGTIQEARVRVGRPEDIGERVETQPWLVDFESGRLYVSPVTLDVYQLPFIEIALPVTNESGEVQAALVAKVYLTALWDDLAGTRVGQGGYAYLADLGGRLLAHREGTPLASEIMVRDQIDMRLEDLIADFQLYNGVSQGAVVGVGAALKNAPWVVVVELPLEELATGTLSVISIILVVLLVSVILIYAIVLYIQRQIRTPLHVLRESAETLSRGDLDYQVDLPVENELGEVANAFNVMTEDLRGLVTNLEQRVDERTRDLEVVSELGRLISTQREPEQLLSYAVDTIQRFTGFYHVQIFLLDEDEHYAVLRASTGEAGRLLLEAGHRLAVGSESVIGRVTASGSAVVALDTEDAAFIHRPNPLLPDTHSEMALPLQLGGRIIGALDVQSQAVNAFDEEDIHVFQTLADQLASAIANALQVQRLEERLQRAEQLNRVLMGEAYGEVVRLRRTGTLGYTTQGTGIQDDQTWNDMLLRAVSEGLVVEPDGQGRYRLAVPIKTREGAVVGAFEFEIEGAEWHEDVPEMAQSLMDRFTMSLETARLFERAQRLASREQQVNVVTARLQEETEMEDVLLVAAEEIRQALGAHRTAIRLDLRSV